MIKGVFADNYLAYADDGYEPRPIQPGTKACKEKDWNKQTSELPNDIYSKWANSRGGHGIGLRLGTPMPNNTVLGALDIDDNRYVRAAGFLLGDPPCGRFGSKGAAYFVRLKGRSLKSKAVFQVKLESGEPLHIGELLAAGSLLVIPPTIHPTTKLPYRWTGKPLLQVDPNDLPIVEV